MDLNGESTSTAGTFRSAAMQLCRTIENNKEDSFVLLQLENLRQNVVANVINEEAMGIPALNRAVLHCRPKIVQKLISLGANINKLDSLQGRSPFHYLHEYSGNS